MIFKSLISCLLGLAASVAIAGPSMATGTGFFVTAGGYFVTAEHVISDAKRVSIKTASGDILDARVVRVDVANDIALLKIEGGNTFRPIPIGNSSAIKKGEEVFTIGYPLVSIQGQEQKVTNGIISSSAGLRDDPRFFQISVPVQQGNSGGPLITTAGTVVGLISSKINALAVAKKTGDIVQNANFAVKSNYIHELINSVNTEEIKLPQPKPIDQSLQRAVSLVEKSVALVIALSEDASSDESKRTPERRAEQAPSPAPASTAPLTKESAQFIQDQNTACRKSFDQDYQAALKVCEGALFAARRMPTAKSLQWIALLNLGDLHKKHLRTKEAEQSYSLAYKDTEGERNSEIFRAYAAAGLGDLYLREKRTGEAESYLEKAITTFEGAGKTSDSRYGVALGTMGSLLRSQNKNDAAERYFKKALEVFDRLPNSAQPVGLTQLNIAGIAAASKRTSEALDLYKKSLSNFERANDRKNQRGALLALAQTYLDLANYDEAEQHAKRALVINETMDAKDQLKPVRINVLLASIYGAAGKDYELESVSSQLLEGLAGEEPLDRARAYQSLARSAANKRDFVKAEDYTQKGLTEIATPDERTIGTYVSILNNQVGILLGLGKVSAADDVSKKAIAAANSPEAQKFPNLLLSALDSRLNIYSYRDDFASARLYIDDLKRTATRLGFSGTPAYAATLFKAASIEVASGGYAEAEQLMKEAMSILDKQTNLNPTAKVPRLLSFAYLYTITGRYSDAKENFDRARDLLPLLGGSRQSTEARFNSAYGFYLTKIGATSDADKILTTALDLLSRLPNEAQRFATLVNYGYLLSVVGRLDEARMQLDAGTAEIVQRFGESHHLKYEADVFLAYLLDRSGKPDAALSLAQNAIDKIRSLGGRDSIDTAMAHTVVASAYQQLGNGGRAIEAYLAAISSYKSINPNHPESVPLHRSLSGLYAKAGNAEAAAEQSRLADQVQSKANSKASSTPVFESKASDTSSSSASAGNPIEAIFGGIKSIFAK